jgi:hypothetical protein
LRARGASLLVALTLALGSSPARASGSADEAAAGAGLLAGLELTSLVLHLAAGVPPKRARKAEAAKATTTGMPVLELERRVFAGEEGLPAAMSR